jgi:hypothetical protein
MSWRQTNVLRVDRVKEHSAVGDVRLRPSPQEVPDVTAPPLATTRRNRLTYTPLSVLPEF